MDVYGIEALLGLPEFRVIDQVIRPKRLDLHLQRRNTSIVYGFCFRSAWAIAPVGSGADCARSGRLRRTGHPPVKSGSV